MKSTNSEERVKAKDTLDALCAPRNIWYEFITDDERMDAVLIRTNHGKQCGVARIFSSPGNFGNKPVVELPKEAIDFLRELALLMGKSCAAAAIVRFRNKTMYWKIEQELQPRQVMKRGKPVNLYLLPVNLLKNL